MNNNCNVAGQMELGFNQHSPRTPRRRLPTRTERAAWWFAKMRAAVDNAITWTPQPAARPQQTWFAQ
jgi:hypothetical protein